MADAWLVSWYWGWRPIRSASPAVPQNIPRERADALGNLLSKNALVRAGQESHSHFLALAHASLVNDTELEGVARVEYRVSPRVRFIDTEFARGSARHAVDHVQRLESSGMLAPTRGPFHLSEILAQGGIAAITLRADLLHGEATPRLGTYVPVAMTRGGGPLEPMQFGLFEVATESVSWISDDVLSRAWHAPFAGGEILAFLPAIAMPNRTRSGSYQSRDGQLSDDPPTDKVVRKQG